MDLFTPIVHEDQQHHNFRLITQPGFSSPELEVIRDWSYGFGDRDGKFVKEFQTTFNSSFWELYLFACFKELNCKVNFSKNTPDFWVNSPYGEFIAEATIANHPKGFRPEWDKDLDELVGKTSMEDIVRLSTIRLSNAISSKHKKYNSTYSELPHVQDKPFVICVAPFEQQFCSLQDSQAIVRLLYAYESDLIIQENKKNEAIIICESRCFRVQKNPGVNLELGLFTDARMSEISAVIFTTTATFSKVRALAKEGDHPKIFWGYRMVNLEDFSGLERFFTLKPDYQETILDGLHILVNPFAKHPLDLRIFENREVAIHRYDSEADNYLPLGCKRNPVSGARVS